MHSPFLFFGNGEEIIKRVYSKLLDVEREGRYAPPLDSLTRGRRDANETEVSIFYVLVCNEIPARGRGEMSFER